jgi:hypothetical protein
MLVEAEGGRLPSVLVGEAVRLTPEAREPWPPIVIRGRDREPQS